MADIMRYNNDFENIIAIIEHSKLRAIKAVNAEMIEMYWQIGKYISEKTANAGWGKSVVQDFSDFLKQTYPSAGGFSAQNIRRMKQFYETYKGNEKLSPLVREITWSNNLLIMSGCKTDRVQVGNTDFFIDLLFYDTPTECSFRESARFFIVFWQKSSFMIDKLSKRPYFIDRNR